ncbi:polysaccharide deacetylase family protein [Brevundimonas sp. SORGH_AS_0993]|uniref:polysaccharide deacetylase family protein n=1 Tax=Brevundimonas sp. SORGH_AS_0993 TaxID=3041794 RepID=UPI00278270CD|nr:polysaccharide deacetylase family protein [Brevundimonas sp. SORGH_AS_0993]MDQ1155270.1 peptidoglycan/xylan/chitin deacetylase (PgdA/CDA1 family) [Brevundimonas sp. SORGH_AS_0993]
MTARPLFRGLTALLCLSSLAWAGWAQAQTQAQAPARAEPRRVALTIDDLPFQAGPQILCDRAAALTLTRRFVDMLRPLHTHATGFVNEGDACPGAGRAVLTAALSVWTGAGLDLGNHTAHHLDLDKTTVGAWLADVDAGAAVTRGVLRARGRPLRWFRHPYLSTGDTRAKHDAAAEGLALRGYAVAPVTIAANDWMFADAYRKAQGLGDAALMRRIGEAYVAYTAAVLDFAGPFSAEVAGGREPPQVLLVHASALNQDWYPRIHALFLARGYRFVPLQQVLADPLYRRPDAFVDHDGGTWLHRWRQADGATDRYEPAPPAWIVQALSTPPEGLAALAPKS